MSGPTVKELSAATDSMLHRFGSLIRRMTVTVTSRPIWKLLGVRGFAGDEVVDAEAFLGIGFYARPPASGKPEAIVVNVGDAKAPIVVAARDEKTFANIRTLLGANRPAAGEVVVFNANVVVYLKSDGAVEIRTPSGTAKRLATIDDLEALRNWAASHTHPVATTGSSTAQTGTAAAPAAPPEPAGTTVLRGE